MRPEDLRESGVEAVCNTCGHAFEVPRSMTGGIANCPACRRAVEVEGLRDPFWRLLQVGAAVLVVAVTAAVAWAAGPVAAVVTGAVLAGILWLVSRAL